METGKFSRNIGLMGLTMIGLTSILGSGWLFGSLEAAKYAGPAAIFSWIIAGILFFLIVFTYMELGAMLPRSGGSAHYLEYSHGPLAGFLSAWINWLAIIACIPAEAIASVQYLSSWSWAQNLFDAKTNGLSFSGVLIAGLLLILYFLINFWSMRLFVRFISAITVIKIIVPVATVIALIYKSFHISNFTAYHDTIAPYGWTAALAVIATSGIVLAFNGFQVIVSLAGEVKNPGRNIPLSIFIAILFCLILYVGLQIAFIGAINPEQIKNGWHTLVFSSPFLQLAMALNLHIMVISLYLGAIVSPSGAAIAYMSATSRMLYAMSENKHMPRFMLYLHPFYKVPRRALCVNLCASFIFLALFHGWASLASLVSVALIISYISGPIASLTLRQLMPNYKRPIRIKALNIIAPLAFVLISLIIHWGRWPLTGETLLTIAIGFVFYAYYQHKQGWPNFKEQLSSSVWLITYLCVSILLSYLGSTQFGGINIIPFGWDMICVALTSVVIFYWGISSGCLSASLDAMDRKPNDMSFLQFELENN